MKKEILQYGKIRYILSVPDDFSEEKTYPLILFLHGAGGRGENIEDILENPYFENTDAYELQAVSVVPQCHGHSWFAIFEQLQDFARFAASQRFIDPDRVYLIGSSMGGYATWQLAMTLPNLFAAAVPICGGGMAWGAARLKNLKIWAFHGGEDTVVLPEESRRMVDAVNALGGDARLTIFDGVAHNSWNNALQSKELFDWLFDQERSEASELPDPFDNQKQFG